jgi:LacI family transcriptional regulator
VKPAENDKQVTIYDIAAKLKISPSTVSRALNNAKYVNKVTKKLVKDEAEKLGYKPNSFAVGLRNNQSNTIGILISRINRPFNSVLISGVEKTARQAGYNVIICQSNDSYENEVTGAEALSSSRVVGLIASLSMETENFEHFQSFLMLKHQWFLLIECLI